MKSPPASGDLSGIALDSTLLAALKLAVSAYAIHRGFSHISDDDYARTVIAERFAHAPRWDPSGTSWLPAPFWITGAVMAVAGRTIAVARGVSLGLGAASVAVPYAAMRVDGVRRNHAAAAAAIAMVLPWNVWLAAATVPEAWTAALTAGAAIALAGSGARALPCVGAALFLAAFSRYEAWPICAFAVVACGWRVARGQDRVSAGACAALAIAAPLLWISWNAYAHGSPTHFLSRVRTFRHTVGAADLSVGDKLVGFPRALVEGAPEAVALGFLGVVGMAIDRKLRRRWGWAVGATALILAFLVVGDVRDGAPTHHPARALAATWWILVGVGVDALGTVAGRMRDVLPRRIALITGACAAAAWCATLPARWLASPGQTSWERRDAQVARGEDMRARGVAAADVTPCAFEHFALIAAWGEPERATIEASAHRPPTAECPLVVEHSNARSTSR